MGKWMTFKEDIWVPCKHLRCSASPVLRKMEVKSWEITSHSFAWPLEKRKTARKWPVYKRMCWWSYNMMWLLWKTVEAPLKFKIELLYELAILLWGVHPKEIRTRLQRDICLPTFIAALFIIAKRWNQSKCLWMDQWAKQCDLCTVEY